MKKRYTPKQQYYRYMFDALTDIAMKDKDIPNRLLKAWDEVANYLGDVAEGRRSK